MSLSTDFTPSFLNREASLPGPQTEALENSAWKTLMHPEDRQAITCMEALPGFSAFCGWMLKQGFEKIARAELIGDAIRLGPNQMPHLYGLLTEVCATLGMRDVPELYLQMDRWPNAYAQGESQPLITITSGLVEVLSEEDIRIVLAHECGHILFKHLRYSLMANLFRFGISSAVGQLATIASLGGLTALEQVVYRWERMSEYSADRVALLFAGDVSKVIRMQLQLACGVRELSQQINFDEWVKQSEDFKQTFKLNDLNGVLANLTLMNRRHPYAASRCMEMQTFSKESTFKAVALKLGTYRCPKCGGKMRSMTMCEKGHFV